jgi:membrane fusion protein (multidrug efflux system)
MLEDLPVEGPTFDRRRRGLTMNVLSRYPGSRGWRLVFGVVVVCLAAYFLTGCKTKQQASQVPDVDVADVVQKDVQVEKEWVGSMDGSVNAVIRAQVQGYLIKQNYTEGQFVKKGQTLFEIDPRTFQAALDQAKADFAQKKARWDTTKANLARIRPLAEQNAVSLKDLDDAVGYEQSAHAAVEAAQAAVEKAKLDLGFTRITSPINGIAGIAKAQIGNLVGPGQVEELTTVSTVDPIKVLVPISEQEFLHLQAAKPAGGAPSRKIDLILSDRSLYPRKGEFAFADRQVDPATGTLKVAIIFPNPGNVLRPGQYAKVRAVIETIRGAVVVPQRAVNELQGNFQVAVVGPDNKVSIRTIKPGVKTGSLIVVSEGLKPGERIVVEGLQKVREGITVNARPMSLETPASQPDAPQSAQPTTPPTDKPVAGHEQR